MLTFAVSMLKKIVKDLTVRAVERLNARYVLLRLTDDEGLPEMRAGQFVEVRVDGSATTFLRRPISICFVDRTANELWLLVACVGDGTRRLGELRAGDRLNCMLPLGNGFDVASAAAGARHLLVGGGVGVAPLLFLGAELRAKGADVTFLLGARSAADLLLLSTFERYGRVLLTTEDGSAGERGFVTQHSVLDGEQFDMVQCCGPTPMMKAVVAYARRTATPCEVSLENLMACGLGACLCCVEKIRPLPETPLPENPFPRPLPEGRGEQIEATQNVCVCKDGPVFRKEVLLWQD